MTIVFREEKVTLGKMSFQLVLSLDKKKIKKKKKMHDTFMMKGIL
jgi:hypothetical protein